MSELPNRSSGDSATTVQISPPDIVRRRVTAWGGVRAEVIEVIRRDQFEYKFHAPHHLLIMSERTSRDDGETLVDGLPSVRDFGRKLILVPAGDELRGWQKPGALTRVTYFYIDPHSTRFILPAISSKASNCRRTAISPSAGSSAPRSCWASLTCPYNTHRSQCRLRRHQLIQRGVSPGDRSYPDRFSPRPRLTWRLGIMMQLIEIPSSKRSSSEARLLLREHSHRINNEFASAIGAISVAAAHSANNEAKAVLTAVQDQLQNYAQVHHALQLPEHSGCIDAAAYERLGLFSSNKGEQTCSYSILLFASKEQQQEGNS
jgi:two-component sensor histidine kinase